MLIFISFGSNCTCLVIMNELQTLAVGDNLKIITYLCLKFAFRIYKKLYTDVYIYIYFFFSVNLMLLRKQHSISHFLFKGKLDWRQNIQSVFDIKSLLGVENPLTMLHLFSQFLSFYRRHNILRTIHSN
jgi:hypothetical protein